MTLETRIFHRCPSLLLPRRAIYALMALLMMLPVSALADLMLYPTRVVLEGNQRAATVELINNGTEPETYRISLVNRRMGENGEFIAIDEPGPGEQFADGLLRYSPRQVMLEPGKAQTVRIMVRKPSGLEEGEYRSHLLFSRLPDPKGRASIESRGSDEGIGIQLEALVGASIPVIVRHGSTDASVELSELNLRPADDGQPPVLVMALKRQGNQSVYGDLSVTFEPNNGGERVVIGKAGGLAVYTPNALRRVNLVLQPPNGTRLEEGTLRVMYRERAENGGKLLAESVLQLP